MNFKRKLVSSYKFQFTIENSKNIYGYISEKIIDCFISGNIPLYSGCKNISEFIPSNAFINLDNFENFSKAYEYIINLSPEEEIKIKRAGIDFLTGENKNIFDAKYNSKIIVNNIVDELL